MSTNPLIQSTQATEKHFDSEDALTLLHRIGNHVFPIMKARSWQIQRLSEFFPQDPGLLGVNIRTGRSVEIRIRLRPHHSPTGFFIEFNDLIGTMLHELVHIVRGPHDAQFYKILDELWEEYEGNMNNGSFNPDGLTLGGRNNLDPAAARLAAEKRAKVNAIMIPFGGRKLGGDGGLRSKKPTPAELVRLALLAAERRARDNKWCGSKDVEFIAEIPIVPASSASSSSKRPIVHLVKKEEDNDSIVFIKAGPSTRSDTKASNSKTLLPPPPPKADFPPAKVKKATIPLPVHIPQPTSSNNSGPSSVFSSATTIPFTVNFPPNVPSSSSSNSAVKAAAIAAASRAASNASSSSSSTAKRKKPIKRETTPAVVVISDEDEPSAKKNSSKK